MEKIYLVAGLGTTRQATTALALALEKSGYELVYLDIPGQFSQRQTGIASHTELVSWFKNTIPSGSTVLAYSLGADLIVSCLDHLQLSQLIVLDGATLDLSDIGASLEQEVEFTTEFIQVNELDIDTETIKNLLVIREEQARSLFSETSQVPTLLLLSDTPPQVLDLKLAKVEQNKNENLTHEVIQYSSHDLFADQPETVAEEIVNWLK